MILQTEQLKRLGARVTMVDGGFDPLHPGHLAYFRAAARLGYPLLCNVRDDAYLTDVKGRPPLLPAPARAELLDSLETITYVHVCSTSTRDVLGQLRPAVYAKGADWRDRLPSEETTLCAEADIRIVFLDTMTGSSTDVVRSFLARAQRPLRGHAETTPETPSSPPPPSRFGCIGSTHMNRNLSGVARFNHQLAQLLDIPCLTFTEAAALGTPPLLLSVKLSDCSKQELRSFEAAATRLAVRSVPYALFFHSFGAVPLELRLAQGAFAVYAGNAEIADMLAASGASSRSVWCPSLLDGDVLPVAGGLTIFSFGMSHKMQPAYYHALHQLLQASGIEHTLLVSTAFHEKASFGDLDAISQGFREIFGKHVHLLGFLSDAAVGHFLAGADVFCAFFPSGVRSNNTSVAAAMSRGVPVVTNLDHYSPGWMRHGHNVLDVARLTPADLAPTRLSLVARHALEDVEKHSGWAALTEVLGAEMTSAYGAIDRQSEPESALLALSGSPASARP